MENGEKEKREKKKCVCAEKKWLGFNYQCLHVQGFLCVCAWVFGSMDVISLCLALRVTTCYVFPLW